MTGTIDLAVIILLGSIAALLSGSAISDVISLLRTHPRKPIQNSPSERRLAFLVPAHNEELLIASCVRSLLNQMDEGSAHSIVVIADNCVDNTARIGRELGVTVFDRTNDELRGKPHAIAWAIERLDLKMYDAVCIVDADCVVNKSFSAALSANPAIRSTVTQPVIAVSNAIDNSITRMASLYSIANNELAFGLKARAGLNIPVGAGLCVGTDLLLRRGWTTFSICEDWELYAQLCSEGERIVHAPLARIYAQETKTLRQGKTQRARWMMGKLAILRTYGTTIMKSGSSSVRQKFDAMAELSSVGPVITGALSIFIASLAVLTVRSDVSNAIALLALTATARLMIYALIALTRVKNPIDYVVAFAFLPAYAIWRLITAVQSIVSPPGQSWIRADRHENVD